MPYILIIYGGNIDEIKATFGAYLAVIWIKIRVRWGVTISKIYNFQIFPNLSPGGHQYLFFSQNLMSLLFPFFFPISISVASPSACPPLLIENF